jgi:predicted chitinase
MTPDQLRAIAPMIKPAAVETFLPYLNIFMPHYEINNPCRQSAFIAQLLHESGEFKYTREIASGIAYEGRADLGNIHNYREISKVLFCDYRLEQTPDLLASPQYAVQSACWFWSSRDLNKQADRPATDKITITYHHEPKIISPFQYITYRINGGFNGLHERTVYYEAAKKTLQCAA